MRAGGVDRRTIRQASRRPITWRGRGGHSKPPLEPSRAATAQANARGERDRARKCARGAAEEVRDHPSSTWSAGVPKLPVCERESPDRLPRLVGRSSSRPSRRRLGKSTRECARKKRRASCDFGCFLEVPPSSRKASASSPARFGALRARIHLVAAKPLCELHDLGARPSPVRPRIYSNGRT